mgnify:FL=1
MPILADIFKEDPDFQANEEKYNEIKKDVLDKHSDSDDSSGDDSGSDSDSSDGMSPHITYWENSSIKI